MVSPRGGVFRCSAVGARLPRGFAPLRRRARGAAFGGARERNSQVARSGSDQEENFSELEEPSYEDLEAQAMEFMKQQSAIETGDQGKLGGAHRRLSRLSLSLSLFLPGEKKSLTHGRASIRTPDELSVSYDTTQDYGTDEVSDEDAERYASESLELLKFLLKNRDMTLNEVKLILAIEDPRALEARRVYGIEVRRKLDEHSPSNSFEPSSLRQPPQALMTNSYHQIPNLLCVDSIFQPCLSFATPRCGTLTRSHRLRPLLTWPSTPRALFLSSTTRTSPGQAGRRSQSA